MENVRQGWPEAEGVKKDDMMEEPKDDQQELSLEELIDIPVLQDLLYSFYKMTGMTSAILDLHGTILTASGWKKSIRN